MFQNTKPQKGLYGNMKYDDVPDALAMFVDWQMSDKSNIAVIMKRPY